MPTPATAQQIEIEILNLVSAADQAAIVIGNVTPGSNGVAIEAGATLAAPIIAALLAAAETGATPQQTGQAVLAAGFPVLVAKFGLPANIATAMGQILALTTATRWTTLIPHSAPAAV